MNGTYMTLCIKSGLDATYICNVFASYCEKMVQIAYLFSPGQGLII